MSVYIQLGETTFSILVLVLIALVPSCCFKSAWLSNPARFQLISSGGRDPVFPAWAIKLLLRRPASTIFQDPIIGLLYASAFPCLFIPAVIASSSSPDWTASQGVCVHESDNTQRSVLKRTNFPGLAPHFYFWLGCRNGP